MLVVEQNTERVDFSQSITRDRLDSSLLADSLNTDVVEL